MKKISLLLLVCIIFCFTACDMQSVNNNQSKNDNKTKEQVSNQKEENNLQTPSISINEEKKLIYWNPIDGAQEYNVYFNEEFYIITNNYFSYAHLEDGTYTIKVKAICNSPIKKSEFSNAITLNHSSIDYDALLNKISTDTIKGCVNVTLKEYNTFLGIETESQTSFGSGVVIFSNKVNDTTYYNKIVTNYHVVEKDKNFDNHTYTVEDYIGNTYKAYLDPNLCVDDYEGCKYLDLATLFFYSSTPLKCISFANEETEVNDKVIAIGQPKGQNNTITIGKCLRYETIRTTNGYNDIYSIVHNSPINNGSSGGALINTKHELIGINFAVSKNNNGKFITGYAIPVGSLKALLSYYESIHDYIK